MKKMEDETKDENASWVTLCMIEEAVLKNTCRPREDEDDKYPVDKKIRSSGSLEGDFQIGMTLFIGFADKLGIPMKDTVSFMNIENDEYNYKYEKFLFDLADAIEARSRIAHIPRLDQDFESYRFVTKFDLITNYMKLCQN